MTASRGGAPLLRGFSVDPRRAGGRAARLSFLAAGPVRVQLERPITVLVGNNGCGKTTLLEALAAKCSIRPEGGGSYGDLDEEREGSALSDAVEVQLARSPTGRNRFTGMFLRADRLDAAAQAAAARGKVRMATTGEWREATEQSRGETVLSLMAAHLDASEARLYFLDEPEVALSPERQMTMLCMLDEIDRDGRSQVVMASHSPLLMAHPNADLLWVDEDGIRRRPLAELPHWTLMKRLMGDTEGFMARLLGD